MIPALALNASGATLALALTYLLTGGAVAMALHRRGCEPPTVLSALAVWPLLLVLLQPQPQRMGTGPRSGAIAEAFAALAATLGDPAACEVPFDDDLGALQQALEQADHRLALVERLLAEPEPGGAELAQARAMLEQARDAALSEVDAVLTGVHQLRLQVGLVALAGQAAPVRERLRALTARASTLAELARLETS